MSGRRLALLCAAALAGSPALAGSIDRSGLGLGALFETGDYFEASLLHVAPSVRGSDLLGGRTGNVGGDYWQGSLSAKFDVTERLSLAALVDQPYGADLLYGTGSPMLGGTRVAVATQAAVGLARYRLDDAFSVHGGLRLQHASAEVRLRGLAYGPVDGYRVRLDDNWETGWIAGAAYERPDIGLRLAATYHSRIEHALPTDESAPLAPLNGRSTTRISTPRSVNIDFQTGIAADTLLFGQLRWAHWSEFRVVPERFLAVTGEGLIELGDIRTYTLGIGHRFSDRWSGALSVHFEDKGKDLISPLSPVNGRHGIMLAAVHTAGKMSVTAGISYIRLGDAKLETGTPDTLRATMRDNHSIGMGVKLGWGF